MSFTGFSEEDLRNMKYAETGASSGPHIGNPNVKKIELGYKTKRIYQQYKSPALQKQSSDDAIDSITFDKCKLSLKSPTTPPAVSMEDMVNNNNENHKTVSDVPNSEPIQSSNEDTKAADISEIKECSVSRKGSVVTPDVVRCVDNYTEDDLVVHKVKLEELQLQQKLMEEQNKKRKEMLAKALADRTKQTEEEVNRLEKIKKELQVLDGQFSLDVAVLRKKIDQACLSYADAEKHYLKVEKEFLQAKINLQKEKEKKELLTEHLCALITHNETRKAQKLETLMLELATDKKNSIIEPKPLDTGVDRPVTPVEDKSIIIDGVDERTGKIVELSQSS